MTDPIADLLTRIRNACSVGKRSVAVPHSGLKAGVVEVLAQEGFISSFTIDQAESPAGAKVINIALKYHNNKPSIVSLQRVSRPSRRVYRSVGELNEFAKDPYAVTIVSTPGGVMSYRQAARKRLGGEILCVIS